jgi:hypothetical protein
MSKSGFDFSGIVVDTSSIKSSCLSSIEMDREQLAIEEVCLRQLENGSLREKLLALESLRPRKNLSDHAFFDLMRIRDNLSQKEGMEEIISAIERKYFHHS